MRVPTLDRDLQIKVSAVAGPRNQRYFHPRRIAAAEIPRKSDIGGVALNLRNGDEVRTACAEVTRAGRSAAKSGIEGVLVSPMRARGVELLAGVTVDPSFGATLAVGLGGIWIEMPKDVDLRVLPVTELDIIGMLQALEVNPLWRLEDRVEALDVLVVTDRDGH